MGDVFDDLGVLSLLAAADTRPLRHKHVFGKLHSLEVIMVVDAADLAALVAVAAKRPAVAVDLEGVNLGPEGEVCIVQLAFAREGPVYLVDLCAPGMEEAAFSRTAPSLRAILESPTLTKLMFDVRADAAALHVRHDCAIAPPVHDLQLWSTVERVSKGLGVKRVVGLAFLLSKTHHGRLSKAEASCVPHNKGLALGLFAPDRGGSYEVWRQRPLSRVLVEYATDARFFFSLRASFGAWKGGRFEETFGPCLAAAVARRLAWATGGPSGRFDKSHRDAKTAADKVLAEEAREALEQWRAGLAGK
jgi:exonuclease 3'-5' domain-containing protein 1